MADEKDKTQEQPASKESRDNRKGMVLLVSGLVLVVVVAIFGFLIANKDDSSSNKIVKKIDTQTSVTVTTEKSKDEIVAEIDTMIDQNTQELKEQIEDKIESKDLTGE